MPYEEGTYSKYSVDNIFTGMIDESGIIWEAGNGRKRKQVGIDAQKEQEYINTISEMQETLDNYYNKLVELGVIEKSKTAEEIAKEAAEQQNAVMAQMIETMKILQKEVKELKTNGTSGYGARDGRGESGQDSEQIRKKPGRPKKSDSAGS